MVGTFTSLYKFLINALPILVPALNSESSTPSPGELPLPVTTGMTSEEKSLHLKLTARAQEALIRKPVKRWYAALAGALAGGLAIMCEKHSRRGVISQQMFVR